MASTFFGLNIGVTGVNAYQTSLNTTAHNLSNIGSDGYSRQKVNLRADKALSVVASYGMIGSGVTIADITQQRNAYFDTKFRYNTSIQGEYDTKEYYLSCVQSYIYSSDNDIGGITTTFDDFFNSLTNLSSEPADMTKRTDAAILSQSFKGYINEFATSLQKLQDEANTQIETTVSQINALGESIAAVTQQINTFEITGETANDLRDERNALLDQLAALVDINVSETAAQDGTGNTQFVVYIDGALLVDSTRSNKIECVAQDARVNQCDIKGLYNLRWDNGQNFNVRSKSLGGTLMALLQFRDGNNSDNFSGVAGSVNTSGDITKIKVTKTNNNDIMKLNIPESEGCITIGNVDYTYDYFDVKVNADGSYEYEFTLSGKMSEGQKETLKYACDNDKEVLIGDSIAYKGIPYYMAQINQFTRTFSAAFNKVQNSGYDLYGNKGIDWFNVADKVTGENYELNEDLTASFSSAVTKDASGIMHSSYYKMTGLNFTVTKDLLEDPRLIAGAINTNSGVEDNRNIANLLALKADNDMFNQGTPDAFLQTLISSVGIDCKQAKSMANSQGNVLKAIDNRREAVSGVDKDEEAADLVKFRNLLYSQYKVISIMDEVLDKLINGTAV